jgi:hypothetical protein
MPDQLQPPNQLNIEISEEVAEGSYANAEGRLQYCQYGLGKYYRNFNCK